MTEQFEADDVDPIRDAIESAEEIRNPLDGLVEMSISTEPGPRIGVEMDPSFVAGRRAWHAGASQPAQAFQARF